MIRAKVYSRMADDKSDSDTVSAFGASRLIFFGILFVPDVDEPDAQGAEHAIAFRNRSCLRVKNDSRE